MSRKLTGTVDWKERRGWCAKLSVRDRQGFTHRVWVDLDPSLPNTEAGKVAAKKEAAARAQEAAKQVYTPPVSDRFHQGWGGGKPMKSGPGRPARPLYVARKALKQRIDEYVARLKKERGWSDEQALDDIIAIVQMHVKKAIPK